VALHYARPASTPALKIPITQNPKEIAGRLAADLAQDGMVLGLGTGSTVYFTLVRLAERIRDEGLDLHGVPTSIDTEQKASEMGLPLLGLDEVEHLDLTIDGADEIDADFQMIKGGGGALLREKVVASITRRQVIVVGRDKLVERLGRSFRLPVEVVPFALSSVARALTALGCETYLRRDKNQSAYTTDNGCQILDCQFPDGIAAPHQLELDIDAIPGVVESGLFIDLAHVCVIGSPDGSVEVRERPAPS
jgi:ribose 5-phosphate isomerase A